MSAVELPPKPVELPPKPVELPPKNGGVIAKTCPGGSALDPFWKGKYHRHSAVADKHFRTSVVACKQRSVLRVGP